MALIAESTVAGGCDACALRDETVCAALGDGGLAIMDRIARRRRFAAGQTIFCGSQPPGFFANVISGVVKLTRTLADGRQQIVSLQFAPDFLGRTFRHDASPYAAEAASDVELCCFPCTAFEAIARKYPDLEHRLFENTLNELDAARDWMLLLGRKTAEEKVASFLLMIARRTRRQGCERSSGDDDATFDLPLTRADIADFTGLTIETVSRHFTRLRKDGVIDTVGSRRIVVPDMDRLAARAEAE